MKPMNNADDGRRSHFSIAVGDLVAESTALFGLGFRLAGIVAHDEGDKLRLVYVFTAGPPDQRVELSIEIDATTPRVPSLSHLSFPASRFERENHDLFGIVPDGHPFLRPLVLHQHWPEGWHPMRRGAGMAKQMRSDAEPFPFVEVEGRGVYEIPVGPVHAGLIEPGHFRFSVVGETILKMKARLWFLHRGIERLFEGRNVHDGVALAERISGDSAVAHNLAYCMAVEEALGLAVGLDGLRLRAMLLELERVYNHVADIGALCNDAGFGVAHARALVIRERLLRINAEVTGHRLLRGAIIPGRTSVLRLPNVSELAGIRREIDDLVALATSNTVLMDRFGGTATLHANDASDMGTLGVIARASGSRLDARVAHPFVTPSESFVVGGSPSGDVLARFVVRVQEIDQAILWIEETTQQVRSLESVAFAGRRGGSGLSVVEGWRGSVVHRVEVNAKGLLTRCKIVDPSFLNWPALSVALADTIVPDFPLVNKSFNLSYAGNDL